AFGPISKKGGLILNSLYIFSPHFYAAKHTEFNSKTINT
ncbi:unnamed protein product, partial [marine sediment metagenome]